MGRFDEQAKEWDNDLEKTVRASTIAKEIITFIKPKRTMHALEFGCGTGLLSFQLKDIFNTITLVDTSIGMMEVLDEKIARENIKNFKPVLIDLLEEKYDRSNFDIIYTLMTIHHIIDISKIFKVFNSMLHSDGYLCIADLVLEDGSFHSNHSHFEGHNGFDRNKFSLILLEYGFKVVYNKICYDIEKELDGKIIKYPVFLMICKKTNL